VHQAAAQAGLREHHEDAVRDVERAVAALEAEGLLRDVGATLRLEYPISGPSGEEQVLLGCVDLVRIDGDGLTVIDYKTDRPPDGAVEEARPVYAEQVRTYARLLVQAGVGEGSVRCGLLFTRDGCIRWVA
jgi:ATP-dependent exoDNAse (exonuclease V) beta subunit